MRNWPRINAESRGSEIGISTHYADKRFARTTCVSGWPSMSGRWLRFRPPAYAGDSDKTIFQASATRTGTEDDHLCSLLSSLPSYFSGLS